MANGVEAEFLSSLLQITKPIFPDHDEEEEEEEQLVLEEGEIVKVATELVDDESVLLKKLLGLHPIYWTAPSSKPTMRAELTLCWGRMMQMYTQDNQQQQIQQLAGMLFAIPAKSIPVATGGLDVVCRNPPVVVPTGVMREEKETATPRRQPMDLCRDAKLGRCRSGASCKYAHSLEALQQDPLHKTVLCRKYMLHNRCVDAKECGRAHSLEELRKYPEELFPISFHQIPKKSQICRVWQKDRFCPYGPYCWHSHEEETASSQPIASSQEETSTLSSSNATNLSTTSLSSELASSLNCSTSTTTAATTTTTSITLEQPTRNSRPPRSRGRRKAGRYSKHQTNVYIPTNTSIEFREAIHALRREALTGSSSREEDYPDEESEEDDENYVSEAIIEPIDPSNPGEMESWD